MTSQSLQGTTVLVTGGAGGLGKAIANAYLDAGASVAVCDIHDARLAATKAEFEPTGRFLAVRTDVTDEPAVESLVSEVVARFGRLDILVNNAGMADTFHGVGELTKEKWDRVLGLNLTGSFLCMKAAVNTMRKQDPAGGTIIQIGSNASYMGFCPGAGTAYTVSKHGVAALVKSTAAFYGDAGVYSVGLMLGAMLDTNLAESMGGGGGGLAEFNMELYRSLGPAAAVGPSQAVQLRDVGRYCVFLADRDVAATANGSCIRFNRNWPKA